jgi:lipid II:glycine glycyltransferase (peptidoglycan interpeptide bridge formation enzyme)
MTCLQILENQRQIYNTIVNHPLQSFEWGEFRKKTGLKVIRQGFFEGNKLVDGFQLTLHRIPHTSFNIGYLPKGNLPTRKTIEELRKIGKEENCIFIQLEPNVPLISHSREKQDDKTESNLVLAEMTNLGLRPSAHPLFTKYTFVLDLTKSEEELLKNMHPKTRYNIKVAQKHGVVVREDNSESAHAEYLKLIKETTLRQRFYSHSTAYHRILWQTLKANSQRATSDKNLALNTINTNRLSAHLLTATYKHKILVAWLLFVFKDTLYYPYGASSNEHKEVMASNLMMWEAIRFGKKLGLKKFDMWGAIGPNPNPANPWYGFHRFKAGFGGELVEFIGSYDLIINPIIYQVYKIADKLRWMLLRLKIT